MKTKLSIPNSIDEYIADFPQEIQAILQKVRGTIHKAAPKATERISYRIPCFVQDGNLVYFAAFKKHIGFYPPVGDKKLREQVSRYAGPKGNLQFPLNEPIPYALIAKIVKQRVKENKARAMAKAKKK